MADMTKEQFETRLETIYKGEVQALTKYLNQRCTMVFHCSECKTVFFGKASLIIGTKEQFLHKCGFPYGDIDGNRFHIVPKRGDSTEALKKKAKKNTVKEGQKQKESIALRSKKFYELVWNDYTYQKIAKELQVNPQIIKDHFIREGLINK
ncbi:adenylate kinase [Peribacillus simplex]|uniref:adenylate kinase n=1 Tax=Peribacillus simplex TaxID=1478 RepID=UPI003D26F355